MLLIAQGQGNAIGGVLVVVTVLYYVVNGGLAAAALVARRKPGSRPLALAVSVVAVCELASCAVQRKGWFHDSLESLWYGWAIGPAILLALALWAQLRPARQTT